MHQVAVELLALVVYGPLVVLLHELGHAAFAAAGGYRVTSFGVGLGRPLWSIYLRSGVVLHVDRWVLAGGACTAIPRGPTTIRRVWFHGGGLIAQALLALVLFAVPDVWPVDRIARFNALVALTNALPWRIGGQASDGWMLWDAVIGGRSGGSVLSQRPALVRMARREGAVGSPIGRVWSEVCIAWADVIAGRPAAAGALLADQPPEATLEPWVDAVYHYVLAEWHRTLGRPLAAVQAAREARGIEHISDEAISLLAVAEARALVDLGEPDQAARVLARVAPTGGPVGAQAAVVLLRASMAGSTEDLELATFRVHRRAHGAWLDPVDAALALREASVELDVRTRRDASRGAASAAEDLGRRILGDALPTDRDSLSERLHPGEQPARARSAGEQGPQPTD